MRSVTLALSLPLVLTACGSDDLPSFDKALLTEFRAAIPSESQVAATKPEGTTTNLVGDPADYPAWAGPTAIQINLAAVGIIHLMRAITDLEPTLFNSATREFLWGPWDNHDDFGTVAAYIKELPAGEDFQYAYALLRGVGTDVQTMVPVIWGAATPDPTDADNGVGITLWDFEANFAFAQANDPDFATTSFDRGRFVAVYGADVDANNPGARFAWDFSVFRNFIPKEDYSASADPTVTGADLDYLYGHYVGTDGNILDFLHFQFALNIGTTATAALESLSVQMAFLNSGWGRAEATASGGDLAPPSTFVATECWDTALDRTYLGQTYTDVGGTPYSELQGTEQGCGPDVGEGVMLFARPLAELGIPTLDDVDATMKAALTTVAENGMPQP